MAVHLDKELREGVVQGNMTYVQAVAIATRQAKPMPQVKKEKAAFHKAIDR